MEFYATLGDPCAKREVLEKLFRAGMTGIRVNLSHTSLAKCAPILEELYWPAARAAGRPDAHLILDLQGPELRVGELPRTLPLREGDELLLGDGGVPIPQGILQTARRGQQISIDDGALLLDVKRASPTVLLCRVVRGGPLLSRKSLSILGTDVDTPTRPVPGAAASLISSSPSSATGRTSTCSGTPWPCWVWAASRS